MGLTIKKILIAGAAFALSGGAYAKHGADDLPGTDLPTPVDIVEPPEVPSAPVIEDHSDVADHATTATDRSDTADRTDVSDRAGAADRGDVSDRSGSADRDSSERSGDREIADRVEETDRSGHGGSHAETSGSDDKLGDDKGGSSGGGSGSGDSGSSGGSGSDDKSGSSGSGSSGGSDDGKSGSGSSSDDKGSISTGESGSTKSAESDDSDIQFARAGGPVALETDKEGFERRSAEVLILGSAADFESVRRAGFEVVAERSLNALGDRLARVRVHDGETIEASIKGLRAAAPAALVDANYGYRQSSGAAPAQQVKTSPSLPIVNKGRIGIIDTGVDPQIAGKSVERSRSFVSTAYTPREHGTAVARLATAGGAATDVADVFEVDGRGGIVASADAIARALDWMVDRETPVINISIEGPPNAILKEVIARALKSGAIIVAAAGNDGPLAAPVYPAAYPGVIAVTAVDKDGNVYRRANRGDYVAFAALGVKAPVALGDKVKMVSGTSFAAPVVSAEASRLHLELSPKNSEQVVSALRRKAVDKGPKGKDDIFGWGVISLDK